MNQQLRPRSEAAASIFETVTDLHASGVVDEAAVRQFAARCLVPEVPEVPDYSAEQIRGLRNKLQLSQKTLARMLNASAVSVQKWEQGAKRPSGTALKLLNILDRKGMDALL